MAQILIRQLNEDLKVVLQKRVKEHGVSAEEEAREILRRALLQDKPTSNSLGTAISTRFKIGA